MLHGVLDLNFKLCVFCCQWTHQGGDWETKWSVSWFECDESLTWRSLNLRWAPASPHILRPRTSPPCWGELRHCHISLNSGPCLLDEVSSDAATCSMAPGSAFLRGKLRCCHMSHSPRWAVDHRNKEKLNCSRHAAKLACFQGMLVHYWSACKTCRSLQCGSIVQHWPSWPLLNMATVVIWPDRTAGWQATRAGMPTSLKMSFATPSH
jgi:hypothetical protein